jgi:integrase/recombinase XerD
MLTIYRRHLGMCEHRGRKYRRCRCPIWADGFVAGLEVRRTLGTRDWEKAHQIIREWEAENQIVRDQAPITVEQACEEFLADAGARKLREPALYKYRLLFRHIKQFAQVQGIRFLKEMDLRVLRQFRVSWADGDIAALKKLERLRAFFRFAQESGWVEENPARKLANPVVRTPPTMPFERDELIRILAACDRYQDNYGRPGQANAQRLRALILLLRYSGLRIRDAVTLPCDRLMGARLFLYTAKTGVPVCTPLPPFVVKTLEAAPRTTAQYFFWTGTSDPKSAVGDWQRSLRKLFVVAEVPHGHAHRFRDTFAVELLLTGVPLERVSALLGHRSVKTTEKHYSPWVKARQDQIEADVRQTWRDDPVALAITKGTPEVHKQREAVN